MPRAAQGAQAPLGLQGTSLGGPGRVRYVPASLFSLPPPRQGLVLATYDAWKTHLWSEINTESLEDANKKISTELRRIGEQNQIVKAWGLYKVCG